MPTLQDIDVLILCGGLGKRLRSVESKNPKVMAAVAGRPFLDTIIEALKAQGVKRIIFLTGYKSDIIEHYYTKNNFGLSFVFSREKEPLGTGGAVKLSKGLIQSDPFIVLNGDSFCDVDLGAFIKFHVFKKAQVSLVAAYANEKKDFGAISLNREKRVVKFAEKKESSGKYLNAGVYCFNRNIFKDMPLLKRFSLEYDFFPSLLGKNFFGYEVKKKFWDIGTPERFKDAQKIFGVKK